MNKSLFEEFDPVSEKAWKQKIQLDLKGKDYNETMLTSTDEGIDIKPFYHSDSHIELKIPSPQQWFITEKYKTEDLEDLKSLSQKGIESCWLSLKHSNEIPSNLNDLDFPTVIQLHNLETDDLKQNKNFYYAFDPVNYFAKIGNWLDNQSSDFKTHQDYLNKTNTLSIDASLYHNAGANMSQQLAYAIAHLNTYLKNQEFKNSQNINILIFNAVSPKYFFEIAKLKALRLLVNTICKKHNLNYDLKLISEPGFHHMSIFDYNVNMLRTTTECMSAVLGGSDFVRNTTYDDIFKNSNPFSQRIARNQLLILKHESYFDKVENIADGSYFIDNITKSLAEKALEIFKTIETSGGFIQQLFDGKIQQKIDQQFQKSLEKFDAKQLKLIGVNQYSNPDDQMKHELEKDVFPSKNKRKTLIKPIQIKRIAEKFEQQRLSEETA